MGKISGYLKRNQDLLVEIVTLIIWGIIALISVVLFYCGLMDAITFIAIISGLIIGFIPIYVYSIKKRNQTMLISFTSKYLLEEESKIDELLGILIAGKWKKLKIDPIDEFFKCLRRLSEKSYYETRRRISEALPALYEIDIEGSKEIVKILRVDWDDKWKSDLRRRTIESLIYLLKKDKKFVRKNIHIIENDEIFSVFAAVEVINIWKNKIGKKEAEKIFKELKNELTAYSFQKQEIDAVIELWDILNLINSNPKNAIDRMEQLKDSPNIYIQVVIARNLKLLYDKYSERTLILMAYFLTPGKHKYVRRPIAKEDSLECLISALKDKKISKKAEAIIWNLISDDDEIIRVSAFDKIENIMDFNREFGKKILERVIESNKCDKLVDRAKSRHKRETT